MNQTDNSFIDHGIPVKAEETRSSVISKDSNDNYYFIICAKGFIMNVNLNTMRATQVPFPENHIGYPFSSFCNQKGLLYTAADKMFMEFNPAENRFTYYNQLDTDEHIVGFSFAEDEEGNIYFGSYPGCHLFSHNPKTRDTKDYGKMDDVGMYVDYIAIDNCGWIYMGVGTEKKGIIAFNPETGEKRQLCKAEERTRGSAYVHKGIDGFVYGHTTLDDVKDPNFDCRNLKSVNKWKKLFNGEAIEINYTEVYPSSYYYNNFQAIHSPFIDASIIKEYQLSDNELVYMHPVTGEETRIRLEYETTGAGLAPMVAGPDGNLYGTSYHPMHFYCYDPENDRIQNFGGKVYQYGGGGNICAYAIQGSIIGGAAYYGGKVHIFDTSKPINIENFDLYDSQFEMQEEEKSKLSKRNRNPILVAVHKEILRPRCATAHIDGESLIFGGFGENGGTGGGLCIYNIRTGEDIVIKNEDLLKYHSTLCMRVLRDGNLIAGTSTFSPCGGHPKAVEGEIYIMDWKTRKVIYRCVPIPGEPEISLMEIDNNQIIHCITSRSIYFAFDPYSKKVLHKKDLSSFGRIVRYGLAKGKDGLIYGVLSKAIYLINPENFTVKLLANPPFEVTAGMALIGDRIYFAGGAMGKDKTKELQGIGTHLWSYKL